jgi:hypothetical protein
MRRSSSRNIFSLQQARELLPRVKHVTAEAVRRAEELAAQLHDVPEDDPEHATLSDALRQVVNAWADDVQSLGLEAKGFGSSNSTTVKGITAGRTPKKPSRIITGTTTGSPDGREFSNSCQLPAASFQQPSAEVPERGAPSAEAPSAEPRAPSPELEPV